MNTQDRRVTIELRIGTSRAMFEAFERGALDAALVLRHDVRRSDGEVLMREPFGWMAAPDFAPRAGAPLPMALQPEPCSVRQMAVDALSESRVPWSEAFVGGGVMIIGAAAAAGLAVAVLARRVAPAGTVDVGERLGLPALPSRELVLHTTVSDAPARQALRTLAGALRATAVTGA